MNSEQTNEIINEIKQRTSKEAFSLTIIPDSQPGIFDSKFGGVPYWNPSMPYPTDESGEKLMLLAQINLSQLEKNKLLPDIGMLQFYIAPNDMYGVDFDEPDKQNTFRVIYHKTINSSVTKEDILQLEPPVSTDADIETPIWKECALEIKKTYTYMSVFDYRFDKLFGEIAHEKFQTEEMSAYNILDEDAYNDMFDEPSTAGHWILGYPYFTQSDPREYNEDYCYYDTLLFQMDSDYINKEDYILWGDCGVANFFINHKDLENKDFSKILYNWDCC